MENPAMVTQPRTMIRIGSICLLLGTASHWFIHPAAHLWQNVADGAMGVAYGLSIGFMLLGARLNSRRRCAQ
jgi:hypothetical protein